MRLMKTINVVAAVIVRQCMVFATQRGYGDWKGWWEFPGGKIEDGESPEAAKWVTKETLRSVEWLLADQLILDKVEELLE